MRDSGTEGGGRVARAREDAANGASHFIAGQTRLDSSAQHIVSKALRRSIADAYAAYTGQVDALPSDDYGLALYALEKTYPVKAGGGTGRHIFNLSSSPFCASKAKHAAIGNAARKILQNLDQYVHEVATLAPGRLNQLANREPVYDDHGNEIPWDPAAAARKAIWGKARSPGRDGGMAHGSMQGTVPYPPFTTTEHSSRAVPARARSSTPPQRIRGALIGTPHKPPASVTVTAAAGTASKLVDGRPATAPAAASKRGHASRSPAQGEHSSLERHELGTKGRNHVHAARMSQQQRLEEQWGDDEESARAARAAMRVVSAAAADTSKSRDPILQYRQRNAQALLGSAEQQLVQLARARIPPVIHLPLHQRVSHYYDHVRPPGPLRDFHVHLSQSLHSKDTESAHASLIRPPSDPQQPGRQPGELNSRGTSIAQGGDSTRGAAQLERKMTAARASDPGVPPEAQQPMQQQQQPQQQFSDGAEGAAHQENLLQQQGSNNAIAQSLGLTDLDDRQLLDIIVLFKQGLTPDAQAPSRESSPLQSIYPGALDAPAPPPLSGTGIFNACNFNRSRRLHPTNVQLHHIRTSRALHLPQPHQHARQTGARDIEVFRGTGESCSEPGVAGIQQQQQQQQQEEPGYSTTSVDATGRETSTASGYIHGKGK
mmetsp:Transcript_5339/g.14349  ORF Transcript_5339/g.14349 Transcript_5339/m.14349 type:complete len:659 (-) Transcript_5339:321-2297(-)